MKNQPPYFFLATLFFAGYLLVAYTDLYGNPLWFKVFTLIVGFAFLSGGIAQRRKARKQQEANKE